MLINGLTLIVEEDILPGCHVYVPAPDAESVVFCPEQILKLLELILMVGVEFTVMPIVPLAIHPLRSDPSIV